MPNEGFTDLVIEMDPSYPSRSIRFLANELSQEMSVQYSTHVHSTISNSAKIPMDFWPESSPKQRRLEQKLGLTLIWKPVGLDPILKTSKIVIKGEVNICRYFCRFSPILQTKYYKDNNLLHWIDYQLDALHQLAHAQADATKVSLAKEMSLCKRPGSLKGVVTLADLCFASVHFRNVKPSISSMFVPVPEIKI